MAFLCLPFITVIHTMYVLIKTPVCMLYVMLKNELKFINFLRHVLQRLMF